MNEEISSIFGNSHEDLVDLSNYVLTTAPRDSDLVSRENPPSRLPNPARRNFLKLAGLGTVSATTAAVASIINSSPLQDMEQEDSLEKQYQQALVEIEEIWGFKTDKDFVFIKDYQGKAKPTDQEKLVVLEIRKQLEIFPPQIAQMLAKARDIYTPTVVHSEMMPKSGADTNMKMQFCQSMSGDAIGGEAGKRADDYTILLNLNGSVSSQAGLSMIHELSHLLHYSFGMPKSSSHGDVNLRSNYPQYKILPGFFRSYAMYSTAEDFATANEYLFGNSLTDNLDIFHDPEELSLKAQMAAEMWKEVSNGLMDEQYFANLRAGKVNLAYWETKTPSNSFFDSSEDVSIYITDLVKNEKGNDDKRVPVLIVSRSEDIPKDEPQNKEWQARFMIAGNDVQIYSFGDADQDGNTNTQEAYIVVNGNIMPFISVAEGKRTTVLITTLAESYTVTAERRNGEMFYHVTNHYLIDPDNIDKKDWGVYEPELTFLDASQLYINMTALGMTATAGCMLSYFGQKSSYTNHLMSSDEIDPKAKAHYMNRRNFLFLGSMGIALGSGIAGAATLDNAARIYDGIAINKRVMATVDRIKAIISRNDEMHKAFRSDELRYRSEHFSVGN